MNIFYSLNLKFRSFSNVFSLLLYTFLSLFIYFLIGKYSIIDFLIFVSFLIIIFLSFQVASVRLTDNNLSFIVYFGSLCFFGIIPFVQYILSGPNYNYELNIFANIIVLVGVLAIFIGESIFFKLHKRQHDSETFEISNQELKIIFYVTSIIISCLFIYILFFSKLSLSTMISTPRMELRLEGGFFFAFINKFIFLISLIILLSYMYISNKLIYFIIIILSFLGCFILSSIFGSRSFMLIAISPIIFIFTISNKYKLNLFWILVVSLPSFVFLFGVLHYLRWQSDRSIFEFINLLFKKESYELMFSYQGSDIYIRDKLLSALELFPKYNDWLYGNTFLTVLFFWIPSSLSLGLKVDTMYKFAYAVLGDDLVFIDRFSDHPTLIGDLYINLGYYYWLGAMFWGYIYGFIDNILKNKKRGVLWFSLGASWSYFLILSFRGTIYQPFMSVIFCVFYVFLFKLVLKFAKDTRVRDH